MIALVGGTTFSFVTFLMFVLLVYIVWYLAKEKKVTIEVRSLQAIEHIPEAIGRCAEVGRPLHQTFGWGLGGLTGDQAAQLIAGLSVLSYAADIAAEMDVPIIVSLCQAEAVPIVEDILRESFIRAGKKEAFRRENVRYLPGDSAQFAYVKGVLGIMAREKPASNILIGPMYAEVIMFSELAAYQGSMTLAGTANIHQLPFCVVAADYTLIGEETYAAGAAISKDMDQLGSLRAQDIGKLIAIALIILGIFFQTQLVVLLGV